MNVIPMIPVTAVYPLPSYIAMKIYAYVSMIGSTRILHVNVVIALKTAMNVSEDSIIANSAT